MLCRLRCYPPTVMGIWEPVVRLGNFNHRRSQWLRVSRHAGEYAARTATIAWQARTGAGRQAIGRQSELIRHNPLARESMTAYERLHWLVRRHGGGDLQLEADERHPRVFVMFVGHGRSGHSLLGSLLDAHPQVAIAHEQYAARHLLAGCPASRVCRALQYNSQIFARLGRSYSGYDYVVPGQCQGRLLEPTVIGDKKGGGTARLLRRDPQSTAQELCARAPGQPLFIHVIRNPFDNIATKALRTGRSLPDAAARYFDNATAIRGACEAVPGSVVHVVLDELIERPRQVLAGLLGRLGLSAPSGYLDACAGLLFASPRRTRHHVAWPQELIARLDDGLTRYPFLAAFAGSFNDER